MGHGLNWSTNQDGSVSTRTPESWTRDWPAICRNCRKQFLLFWKTKNKLKCAME